MPPDLPLANPRLGVLRVLGFKLAGDPVDVYVNGQPVARGEVLVLNDNFCVRINEILSPAQADMLRDIS